MHCKQAPSVISSFTPPHSPPLPYTIVFTHVGRSVHRVHHGVPRVAVDEPARVGEQVADLGSDRVGWWGVGEEVADLGSDRVGWWWVSVCPGMKWGGRLIDRPTGTPQSTMSDSVSAERQCSHAHIYLSLYLYL